VGHITQGIRMNGAYGTGHKDISGAYGTGHKDMSGAYGTHKGEDKYNLW
jgi:hypothetical protein